jgi:DNA repair protein RAD50
LNKAQHVLSQLNERKAAHNQSKAASKAQITANDRKLSGFQSDLDKIDIDEGSEAVLKSTKDDVERRLHTAKEDYKKADWDKQLQQLDTQTRGLDDRKEALDAELIDGTRQASQTAELDILRKNVREIDRSLATMKEVYGERISSVVGSSWTSATLEQSFQSVLDEKNSEVKDIETQREGMNRELEHILFKLKTVRNEIAKKTSELQKCERTCQEAIGSDKEVSEFETELQALEDEYEEALANQEGFKFVQGWYKKALDTSKNKSSCHMCLRKFGPEAEKEKKSFETRIEGLIQKAIEKAQKDSTDAIAEELEKVKTARPSYEHLVRLRDTEIPALSSEEKTLRSRNENLEATAEQQDSIMRERQTARRDVESLVKTVQNIVKYHSESIELNRKITALAIKQEDTGMSRGLEKIQEDLKQVAEQSKSAKSRLNQLQAERDRARSSMNTLELEARDIQSKIATASYELKEKATLASRIEELKSHSGEQRDAIRRLDEDIRNLVPQVEQAQIKYDDINRRGAERDRELQQEASRLSDSHRQLLQADQDINAYKDKGGPEQLARTRREIQTLEGEVSRLEAEMRQVTIKIKTIDEHLRDTDETKRAINDNLRFRRGKRDLEALYAEIEQLESHNAESDKDRYDREGQKWQLERNKLTAEQASIIGSLKSKDDQLQELLRDWDTEYKDAAYKYREAHIKVETTKAAVEDLGRYGGALDKAIMKYHAIKMEEINRIVEELWRKTYQGTDVDTIAIRSDNENLKGNKSYNYRVVMVKQDAEMDMRGRCSAGQKVLASIIIRLALAECFGVNCGLIALDEPTTNLDRENIQALAEALAEIIKVRRQQSNFQLIVITHDEEFLKYMQCADFCDTYYRVSRNARQKSIIERQSIAEVSAHLHYAICAPMLTCCDL